MKKLIMLLMAVLMLAACAGTDTAYADENELVIVLDPGHDSTHAGAGGNGVREEKAVLKIGLYLREELNKYENVKVYMIREGEACAFPDTHSMRESSKRCNEARVAYAESVGADVLISLHLNSFTNSSANGVLAFVQNNNYDSETGAVSQSLGRCIVNKIAELGLANGGIVTKGSDWDTLPEEYYYEDGSIADYYRVLRYSKKVHMPALIVEHAFLSNASDAAKVLTSEAGLKTLAIKDAEGIAEYYGLTLKEGCVAGELSDITSIPGTQTKPTLITEPVAPQPTPEPESESEAGNNSDVEDESSAENDSDVAGDSESENDSQVETESETETDSDTETELESEMEPQEDTEAIPEGTEEEIPTIGAEEQKTPWGGIILVVALIIFGGGGIAVYWWKKQKSLH